MGTTLEELNKVLDNAGEIAKKMSHHDHADITVASFRIRWDNAHKTSKVWVHCMEELYKCWNDLEQKIVTLTTWVDTSKSSEPAKDGLSIDKLEEKKDREFLAWYVGTLVNFLRLDFDTELCHGIWHE